MGDKQKLTLKVSNNNMTNVKKCEQACTTFAFKLILTSMIFRWFIRLPKNLVVGICLFVYFKVIDDLSIKYDVDVSLSSMKIRLWNIYIQCNAICVTTCVKDQSSGLEGLFNFQVHEAEELWSKKCFFIPNIFLNTLKMNKC